MTHVDLDPAAVRPVVEARLGRDPQDMLEAAVVLEAWAGMGGGRALLAGRRLMSTAPATAERSVAKLPRPQHEPRLLRDGAAFVIAVIAIAFWAAPLTSDLGVAVVRDALTVALSLTLALQWALRSRFLDHRGGLLELARHRVALVLAPGATVLAGAVALGHAGTLAALLTVTWVGGTILLRRNWPLPYVTIVLAATAAMAVGLPALDVVRGAGVLTTLAAVAALRPHELEPPPMPAAARRAERTACSAAIGAGVGLMLVLDPSVSWTAGAVPALALAPSAVAALWGAAELCRLEPAILRGLAGVPVRGARSRPRSRPALGVLLGAVGRLLALTAALSALLLLTPWLGDSVRGAGVLAGFGLLALASLLVGLLDSLGGSRWVLAAVALGVGVEALVRIEGDVPFAGVGLVAGGATAAALALPALVVVLRRSARTVATTLWIR